MYQLPIDHLQTKEQIQLMTIYYDPARDDAFCHPLFPSSKLFRLSFWDYCEDFHCKSYNTFHISLKEHVHAMFPKNRKKITFQMSKKGNKHSPSPSPTPSPPPEEPNDQDLSEQKNVLIARIASRMFQLSVATPASEVGNRYDGAQLLPVITGFILNREEIPAFPSSMGGRSQQYDIFFSIYD